MKTINKFFQENKKPLLIALGVIVTVVVVWIIVKKLRKNNPASQKTEIENETGQTVTQGLVFDELAKRMFNAWISTWGTDEAEVYSILGLMNTQADWEYLQARYESYWNSMSFAEQLVHITVGLGLSGNLVSDFRRELTKKELQRCRDILTEKGINPGF